MTIATMHNNVKVEMDKTSGLELPSLEPEEIDYWLNDAISQFIETRYSGNNHKRTSVEENRKRIDDLRSLINFNNTAVSTSSIYSEGYSVSLPTDYLRALNEEVIIKFTSLLGDITTKQTNVTPVTQNNISFKLRDPYSPHILYLQRAEPLRVIIGDKTHLITDGGYEVTNFLLTYIKKPAIVSLSGNISCNLPEHTHREIVKIAANLILENIESPRYRSQSIELSKME